MYPTLFRIGNFDVTSFGVMVAIGALWPLGIWPRARAKRLARIGRRAAMAASLEDCSAPSCVGGRASRRRALSRSVIEPWRHELWFGGFAGGVRHRTRDHVVGSGCRSSRRWPPRRRRSPSATRSDASAVSCRRRLRAPERSAVGRGVPRGLPPIDVPVHPTQLYEMFALFSWRGC